MKNHTSFLLEQVQISSLMTKRVESSLTTFGLSYTEFVIMHTVYQSHQGALSRIALADAVGLTASAVTRLLAPMEKNNITQREANPRDARQSLVRLTETGKELYENALVSVDFCSDSVYSLFEKDEIKTLKALLNKVKC